MAFRLKDLLHFKQRKEEPFYLALERFEDLLDFFLNHGLEHLQSLAIFAKGLEGHYQELLNESMGCIFPGSDLDKACRLVSETHLRDFKELRKRYLSTLSNIPRKVKNPRCANTRDNPKTPEIRRNLEASLEPLGNTNPVKNERIQETLSSPPESSSSSAHCEGNPLDESRKDDPHGKLQEEMASLRELLDTLQHAVKQLTPQHAKGLPPIVASSEHVNEVTIPEQEKGTIDLNEPPLSERHEPVEEIVSRHEPLVENLSEGNINSLDELTIYNQPRVEEPEEIKEDIVCPHYLGPGYDRDSVTGVDRDKSVFRPLSILDLKIETSQPKVDICRK
jgi:hypothetical protein